MTFPNKSEDWRAYINNHINDILTKTFYAAHTIQTNVTDRCKLFL